MKLLLLALALTAVSAQKLYPSCDKPLYCNSKLLHYVQMARIFPDSKTFVDLHMKYDENTILNAFDVMLIQTNDQPSKQQLETFLNENFESLNELENWTPTDFVSEPSFLGNIKDIELRQFAKNIHNIWPILGRKVKPIVLEKPESFSMIPVQNGFIVPGLRLKELYYWDTYWIIEGLLVSGMKDTVKGILNNLVYLQRQFGHIPNGNRWYFQQRSQPPLLLAMVMKYIEATHDVEFLKTNIDAFESELQYWIDTQSVVFKKEGKEHTLLRYYTPSEGPRPEWYYEDYTQAQNFESEERRQQYYNDIKSAAESGWDFSSRWFINQNGTNIGNLTSTHATNIVPVDLNSIFVNSMQCMAYFYSLTHNSRKGAHWAHIVKQWRNSIKEVMWNNQDGIWYDYDLSNDSQRKYFYPSNLAPLWMDVVDKEFMKEHAQPIIEYMKKTHSLEFPGGIPTSFSRTGQKWDYPYAWAPLVSMVVKSLEALKTEESEKLAYDVVKNWVRSNLLGYTTYKQLFDKYNVEAPGKLGEEEEYAVQAGFGWTNGATLQMLAKYGNTLKAQDGYYNFHTYNSNPVFWHIPTSAYLPSYYKSSNTAPVYTSSVTNGNKPAVVSWVSSEHKDVSVSGKPGSITLIPSTPVKPQLIPSASIKPEYIPSVQVKPQLIPSTPIKPELVPTVPAKPTKPVHQGQILSGISYSEHAQTGYPTEAVHVLPSHESDVHASEIAYDTLVPSVPVKPEIIPSAHIKPELVPSIPVVKPEPVTVKPVHQEHSEQIQSVHPAKPATQEIIPPKASVGSFVSETAQSSYTGSAFQTTLKPTELGIAAYAPSQASYIGSAITTAEYVGSDHSSSTFVTQQQEGAAQAGSGLYQIHQDVPALPQSGNFGGAVLNTASNFASGQAQFEQTGAPQAGFSVGYKPVQTEKPSPVLTQSGNVAGAISGSGFSGAVLNTASNFATGQAQFGQTAASQAGFSVGYKPVQSEKPSPALTQSGNVAAAISGSGFSGAVLNTASNFATGQAQFEQTAAPQAGTSIGYKPVEAEKPSLALTQSGNFGGAVLNTASNFASGQAQFEQTAAPQAGFSIGYKPVESQKPALTQSGNVGGALSSSGFSGAVLNTVSNYASGQAQFEQTAAPQAGFSVGYKPVQTEKPSPVLTQSGNVAGAISGSGFSGAVLNTASNFATGQAQFEQTAAPQAGFSIGYKPALTQSGGVAGALSESGFSGAVLNTASNFASGQAQFEQNAAPQAVFSVGYKPVESEKPSLALTQSGNVNGALSGSGVLSTASNYVSGQAQLQQSDTPQAGVSYGNKPDKQPSGFLATLSSIFG